MTLDLANTSPPPQAGERDMSAAEAPDLVHRLRDRVAERPSQRAVRAPEGDLTYADLGRLSNQLAHMLRALGVTRGCRVGISLNRGARELIALLATSKVGGTYVPLDPSQPPERLRSLCEDAAPQLLILESGSSLIVDADATVWKFDRLGDIDSNAPSEELDTSYSPDDLAYLMFTSGSTGRPKGVEVRRGGFSNLLESLCTEPGVTADDRLLAIATTAFDISGYELCMPLWVGGTVVIADRETAQDPVLLKRCLEREKISLLQATPATWRMLLGAGWTPNPGLRMTSGGEPLTADLAERLLGEGCELWNLYGPTETTICSSVDRVLLDGDNITIGRPIQNTTMYVLDEALNRLADGQEGELCIGGRGVARGYHNRPELTADRFVQDPLGEPGEMIYRTGDLARKREDGRFECLGRLDHQVKIRGVRVELGEIESLLCALPGVEGAVVVADSSDSKDPRLLAYWVGRAGRQSLIDEVRRKLPANIAPSGYIRLDAFPLNQNSKVDRKQLPPLEAKHMGRPSSQLREFNILEARVAATWCDVLDLESVALGEDFFTIGGTSARAAEVVALLFAEIGLEMPLQEFFVDPTIEGIAAALEDGFHPNQPAIVQLREGDPNLSPLWCLFGISIYRHLAAALNENRTVYGVHVPFLSELGQDKRPATSELATEYVDTIRSRQPDGPYQLMGLCFGGIVAFEVAAQLEAEGEEIELVTIVDTVLPTAVRVDSMARLRSYAETAWREPLEAARSSRELISGAAARLVKRLFKLPVASHNGARLTDISTNGPEVQAEVEEFTRRLNWLSSSVLVARATAAGCESWLEIDPDLGWQNFARKVIVRDIDSDHLHTLQPPHVRDLADAMTDALSEAKAETEV